jgi:hypothetical protein
MVEEGLANPEKSSRPSRFGVFSQEQIEEAVGVVERRKATDTIGGFFRWLAKYNGSIQIHNSPNGTEVNIALLYNGEQHGYRLFMDDHMPDSEFWETKLQPAAIELYREITNGM